MKTYTTDMQPHFTGLDRYIVSYDKKRFVFTSIKEFYKFIEELKSQGYKREGEDTPPAF